MKHPKFIKNILSTMLCLTFTFCPTFSIHPGNNNNQYKQTQCNSIKKIPKWVYLLEKIGTHFNKYQLDEIIDDLITQNTYQKNQINQYLPQYRKLMRLMVLAENDAPWDKFINLSENLTNDYLSLLKSENNENYCRPLNADERILNLFLILGKVALNSNTLVRSSRDTNVWPPSKTSPEHIDQSLYDDLHEPSIVYSFKKTNPNLYLTPSQMSKKITAWDKCLNESKLSVVLGGMGVCRHVTPTIALYCQKFHPQQLWRLKIVLIQLNNNEGHELAIFNVARNRNSKPIWVSLDARDDNLQFRLSNLNNLESMSITSDNPKVKGLKYNPTYRLWTWNHRRIHSSILISPDNTSYDLVNYKYYKSPQQYDELSSLL